MYVLKVGRSDAMVCGRLNEIRLIDVELNVPLSISGGAIIIDLDA